jgi:hypothetical protein
MIQAKFAEFKHANHTNDNKRVATGFGAQSRYRVDLSLNQSLEFVNEVAVPCHRTRPTKMLS